MKEQIKEMAKVLCEDCAKDPSPCPLTESERMCDAVLEQAEALYNAGYRKQSEWISVEDRMPEKLTNVIVHDEDGTVGEAFYLNGDYFEWVANEKMVFVTHWMQLPQPPEMKGGAE